MRHIGSHRFRQSATLDYKFEEPTEEPPKEPSSEQLRAEDEELRRALELSVIDQGGRGAASSAAAGYGGEASSSSAAAAGPSGSSWGGPAAAAESSRGAAGASHVNGYGSGPAAAQASSPSAATATPAANPHGLAASRVRALYDFQPSEAGELAFQKGDVIRVLDSIYDHWWRGELRGEAGIFPVNYVEILPEPTAEDIQRDAEMEARIFGPSAAAIDELLQKLATLDPRKANLADDEALQELYQQALSVRPKIVRLIDRYSAKVAELKSLNEKFVQARGRFEGLMEESLRRFEPSRAGVPSREYMGHRQPSAQQQQQQPVAGAPQQPQVQAQPQGSQQDYSQQWAAYYAQQQQQAAGGASGSAAPAGVSQATSPGLTAPQAAPVAAAAIPQPPPGLSPSDPAYAQWYYSHFGTPQQQQQVSG